MKLLFSALLTIFFAINTANAQHDHSSHENNAGAEHSHKAEPPHGGEIKDVGKYHFEIVFDAMAPIEKLNIYILKSNLKTLDTKGTSGSINIKYTNGTELNYELQNNNIDKLFCDVKDVAHSFTAIIKIKYKEKEYSCAYNYKGIKD